MSKNQSNSAGVGAPEADSQNTSTTEPKKLADVGNIANAAISNAPDVSEHAVQAHEEKQRDKQSMIDSIKAKFPDFDPDIHAVDDNGQPILNADKKTLRKKRGRKALNKPGSKKGNIVANAAPQLGVQVDPNEEAIKKARYTGEAMAGFFIGCCQGLIDAEEWAPIKTPHIDERAELARIAGDYCLQTGLDMPPSLALLIGFGSYVMPRIGKEKTQAKIKKLTGGKKKAEAPNNQNEEGETT
jgi:hypothetical protein